jgi:hypothetical protein
MSRDPLDRYYTDDRLALACINWLFDRFNEPAAVLEPCAGGGAFGRAARRAMPETIVRGCDIDPDAAPGYPCDQSSAAAWSPRHHIGASSPVWIVTNPHYQGIYETVHDMRALQRRTGAGILALLLRETTIGHLIAGDDPPHFLAVSPIRPRWGGPGGAALKSGDTCGSVLCVWRGLGQPDRPTTIEHLPAWRAKGAR